MWEASWRRALRTSMYSLRCVWNQGGDAVRGLGQGRPHAFTRRSADDVMAIERRLERNCGIEIFRKLLAELAHLFQRQIAEFYALLDREAHRVADLLVRFAEGNSLMHEVG